MLVKYIDRQIDRYIERLLHVYLSLEKLPVPLHNHGSLLLATQLIGQPSQEVLSSTNSSRQIPSCNLNRLIRMKNYDFILAVHDCSCSSFTPPFVLPSSSVRHTHGYQHGTNATGVTVLRSLHLKGEFVNF